MSLQAIADLHGLLNHAFALHAPSLHGLSLDSLKVERLKNLQPRGFHLGGLRFKPRVLQDVAILAGIVALPFAAWFTKRWVDRWEERQQREEARRCAVDVAVTLAKSIQLCETIRVAIQASGRVPDATVEAAIDSLDLSRQRLRLYLSRHIPLHELIPLAAAAEQQLAEGCQAMQTLYGPPGGGFQRDAAYAGQLQTVRAELQSVADRLRRLQPDLGRAIAKVDAGWALTD
jgi:hypothetical protein